MKRKRGETRRGGKLYTEKQFYKTSWSKHDLLNSSLHRKSHFSIGQSFSEQQKVGNWSPIILITKKQKLPKLQNTDLLHRHSPHSHFERIPSFWDLQKQHSSRSLFSTFYLNYYSVKNHLNYKVLSCQVLTTLKETLVQGAFFHSLSPCLNRGEGRGIT